MYKMTVVTHFCKVPGLCANIMTNDPVNPIMTFIAFVQHGDNWSKNDCKDLFRLENRDASLPYKSVSNLNVMNTLFKPSEMTTAASDSELLETTERISRKYIQAHGTVKERSIPILIVQYVVHGYMYSCWKKQMGEEVRALRDVGYLSFVSNWALFSHVVLSTRPLSAARQDEKVGISPLFVTRIEIINLCRDIGGLGNKHVQPCRGHVHPWLTSRQLCERRSLLDVENLSWLADLPYKVILVVPKVCHWREDWVECW